MFGKKTPEPTTRLRELSGSDYTIPKGQPDIRGWDVRDASKLKFGTVQDLIFDIRAGKVRYMVLQILDTPELDLDKRTVLVPIGLAELDASDNDVFLPSVNAFQLRALPSYKKSLLGAKAEHDVRSVFGATTLGSTTQQGMLPHNDVDEGFYNHEHFNENNMLRRRQGFIAESPSAERPQYQEEPVRRRDLEVTEANAKREADEAYRRGFEDGQRHRAETDDEYLRRTGKNREL
jgi:hypothetical protein